MTPLAHDKSEFTQNMINSRDVTKFVFAFDNMQIFDNFTAIRYSTNSWGRFWRVRIFHFVQLDWTLL